MSSHWSGTKKARRIVSQVAICFDEISVVVVKIPHAIVVVKRLPLITGFRQCEEYNFLDNCNVFSYMKNMREGARNTRKIKSTLKIVETYSFSIFWVSSEKSKKNVSIIPYVFVINGHNSKEGKRPKRFLKSLSISEKITFWKNSVAHRKFNVTIITFSSSLCILFSGKKGGGAESEGGL